VFYTIQTFDILASGITKPFHLFLGPWATYVDEAKVAKPSEVK